MSGMLQILSIIPQHSLPRAVRALLSLLLLLLLLLLLVVARGDANPVYSTSVRPYFALPSFVKAVPVPPPEGRKGRAFGAQACESRASVPHVQLSLRGPVSAISSIIQRPRRCEALPSLVFGPWSMVQAGVGMKRQMDERTSSNENHHAPHAPRAALKSTTVTAISSDLSPLVASTCNLQTLDAPAPQRESLILSLFSGPRPLRPRITCAGDLRPAPDS
ncbi:hypothetical protein CC85DRAFT_97944 [Cutaneotrichosporon oleaginosum]|uniref:Uncharacterized protein n=1 Tax=Cutaneotrichosporon oleaginosum TaxID=879819 RepID=A0A0J0XM66_9TREE|nr:uncharacterized protein CC85DRAFT_97944 [Cutaneotrichosporon oleaginosum]KLT42210.1 hypothetical protein CC85DRAFT_97944 [Cutaneotrichosporon oleaginosum]TXT11671.1 hypothetical protein COLE_02081 [Cutaneotrichosporon oleaginosum]